MTLPLDQDLEQLESLLHHTVEQAWAYLQEIGDRPAATDFVPQPMLSLPDQGQGAAAALDLFMHRYGHAMPASNGPRFWGFVTGGTTPAALMGDWLTSTYDLNLTSVANSTAPNIEQEAVQWLRQLFGLPPEFGGTFVTGATMSNLVGLAIAREWVAQQQQRSIANEGLQAIPPITVLSGIAHSSIYKALAILGMGRQSLKPVPLLPGNREAVDVAALRQALEQQDGQPCIVVGNAGTVNTVDFDDLGAIAALKTEFPFWFHVDAAFGGFAACSPQYRSLTAGMTTADSLTIDAHKWLNVPYDAALLFTPHRALQLAVFQNSAAYLGAMGDPPDFVHLSPENSRRMRALPTWFSLMAYGQGGYQALVERNCAQAQAFAGHIEVAHQFRLLAPVRLNGVCFTLAENPSEERVTAFLTRLRQDGRIFLTPTVYQGIPAIRAAFTNCRTREADVAIAWQALQDCC